MRREVTVTITREMEVDVTVGLYEGSGPTWTDPGEPDEAWIVRAEDEDRQTVELTDSEAEEAVGKAWQLKPEPEYEPDDDQHKPF